MPTLFKCTHSAGRSVHGFTDPQGRNFWPLPQRNADGTYTPGAWKGPVAGPIKPHHRGLHMTPEHMLVFWLRDEIYEVELRGEYVRTKDCVVSLEARALRPWFIDGHAMASACLELAHEAFNLFEALVYPHDVLARLRAALQLAEETFAQQDYHPAYRVPPPSAHRTWRQLHEVVAMCRADATSGFETNLNTEAALHAVQCIALVQHLNDADASGQQAGGQRNGLLFKQQTAHFMRAVSGCVEDLMLNYGHRFRPAAVPQAVQPYAQPHPLLPRLHHAARWHAGQRCNAALLDTLSEAPR